MSHLKIIGPDDPALNALALRIGEYNRNRKEHIELEIISWPQYKNRLDAALEAHDHVDACFIPGHVWLGAYAGTRKLLSIEDVYEQSPLHMKPKLQKALFSYEVGDIVPQIANDCRFEGKQYLLPLFTDGHLFFCEATFYEQYQSMLLDPEGRVRPSNLIEVARHMSLNPVLHGSRHQPHRYPLALKSHPSELLLDFLPYFWDMGGEFVAEDALDSQSFKTMVERSCDLYRTLMEFAPPETKSFGNAEIADALASGKVVMAISWGGQAAPIVQSGRAKGIEFSIAPLATSWNATWGIGINAAIDRERSAKVLCNLLELMDRHLDELVADHAGSPVRQSTYENAAINSKCSWLKAQCAMLQLARHLPSDPSLGASVMKIAEAISQTVHGK